MKRVIIFLFLLAIGVVYAQEELKLVGREVHPDWACSYYRLYYKGKDLKTDLFTLGVSNYREVKGEIKSFSIEWWVNDSYTYYEPVWGTCIDEITREKYDCIVDYKEEIRYGKYFPISTLEIGKLTPSYNLERIQKQSLLALKELAKKGYIDIRICGKYKPLRKNGIDYVSIEHIPVFRGAEYKKYDWWNGSYWGNRFNATGSAYAYLDDSDDKVCYALTVNKSDWYDKVGLYIFVVDGNPPNYTVGFKESYTSTNWIANTSYDFSSSGWHTITLNQSTWFDAGDVAWVCIEPDPNNPPDSSNRLRLLLLTPEVDIVPYDSHLDENMDVCYYTDSWSCGYTPSVVLLTNDSYKYGQPFPRGISLSIDESYIRGERFKATRDMNVTGLMALIARSSTVPDADLYAELRDSSNTLLASCKVADNDTVTTSFESYNCSFDESVSIIEGSIYYFILEAPDITNGGDYYIREYYVTYSSDLSFNGTDAYYVYDSTSDNGSSYTSYTSNDIYFVLVLEEEGAPTDNPPSVTLNSPSDGYSTTETSITFNATASDDYNVANMTLYGNFTGTWQANETKTTSGTSVTETWTKTLDVGYYVWNVKACDNASQCSFASQNFTLTIEETGDTTPPELTFVAPTPNNETIEQNYAYINVTSNEELSTAKLEWDGTNESMQGSGTNWYLNKTNLANGNYTFLVWGSDTSSNWNKTEVRWVYINYTAPSDDTPPTYSSQSRNTSLSNASCKFQITFNDNVALDPNGQWIFSWNGSGSWANDSATNFTSTPETVSSTKTLPPAGTYLCYKWYAKDNASNWVETPAYCFTTSAPLEGMTFEEFLIYNSFLFVALSLAFKTRRFEVSAIFTAIGLLFIFNLAYTDVTYRFGYVTNETYTYGSEQVDYINYNYDEIVLDKNLYTYFYFGLLLATTLNLIYKFESFIKVRRRKKRAARKA